jgi:hypothetical protein
VSGYSCPFVQTPKLQCVTIFLALKGLCVVDRLRRTFLYKKREKVADFESGTRISFQHLWLPPLRRLGGATGVPRIGAISTPRRSQALCTNILPLKQLRSLCVLQKHMDPSFWVQKGAYKGILGEGWLLIDKLLGFETETQGTRSL